MNHLLRTDLGGVAPGGRGETLLDLLVMGDLQVMAPAPGHVARPFVLTTREALTVPAQDAGIAVPP